MHDAGTVLRIALGIAIGLLIGIGAYTFLYAKGQFYLDFIEAENSMGFHADQEAVRILGESIDFSRRGQAVLSGMTLDVPSPARPEPGVAKTASR